MQKRVREELEGLQHLVSEINKLLAVLTRGLYTPFGEGARELKVEWLGRGTRFRVYVLGSSGTYKYEIASGTAYTVRGELAAILRLLRKIYCSNKGQLGDIGIRCW